jgi:branched-chain amino acid aminotransferase group I
VAIVYLNRRFVQAEQAKISAFDRGFSYGDGLFETLRAYSGWVFALDRHLRRLGSGAVQIGLRFDGNLERWRRVMIQLLRRNGLIDTDSSLRLTVTRGVDILGALLPPESHIPPTLLVVARPVEKAIAERQQVGIGVVTIQWGTPFNPFGIKSVNYLYHMLAMVEAREQGAREALFVASDGLVIEAATSNVFSVANGVLTTPPEDAGLLPGITREVVIEIARKEGLDVREASLFLDDLFAADEAFLTGSVKEIMPLVTIDGKQVGAGTPGPITRLLQERYWKAVEDERARGLRRRRSGSRRATS